MFLKIKQNATYASLLKALPPAPDTSHRHLFCLPEKLDRLEDPPPVESRERECRRCKKRSPEEKSEGCVPKTQPHHTLPSYTFRGPRLQLTELTPRFTKASFQTILPLALQGTVGKLSGKNQLMNIICSKGHLFVTTNLYCYRSLSDVQVLFRELIKCSLNALTSEFYVIFLCHERIFQLEEKRETICK